MKHIQFFYLPHFLLHLIEVYILRNFCTGKKKVDIVAGLGIFIYSLINKTNRSERYRSRPEKIELTKGRKRKHCKNVIFCFEIFKYSIEILFQ